MVLTYRSFMGANRLITPGLPRDATTDSEARFSIEGLVPGRVAQLASEPSAHVCAADRGCHAARRPRSRSRSLVDLELEPILAGVPGTDMMTAPGRRANR